MHKLLRDIEKYTIYITIFLVPLVFFSGFSNPFATIKIIFLVVGVFIALSARLIRAVFSGGFEFHQGTFDFPVFLIMLAYFISGIYSPNRFESFFLPGVATITIASGILYFLVNQLGENDKEKVTYTLLTSAVVSSILYLLAITGLFEKIGSFPAFMNSRNFTTQGTLLATGIILIPSLIYSIGLIQKTHDYLVKIVVGCATTIIAISLVLSIFNLFTGNDQLKLASWNSSTSVALDSLKDSAIVGVGPSNFLTAYTRFRPLTTNTSQDWASRFTHAHNFFLTAITETGFFGTFAIILLIIVLGKTIISKFSEANTRDFPKLVLTNSNLFAALVLFLLLTYFPATSIEIYLFLFVGLSLVAETRRYHVGNEHLQVSKPKIPALVASTPIFLAMIFVLVNGSRAVAAEYTYKVAIDNLAKNNAPEAYKNLQSAIATNGSVDRYHATYSQINFLLAAAIAKKQDVTDEDRKTITQLIQQAIREAKTTVAVNRFRASNWEMLGSTYRNVMQLSKDADQFAIQSYTQAVALDPMNPDLRVALGGIWFSVKNYENAIEAFKSAIVTKADHANARYNLAVTYREKGEIERAIAEMKTVLTLLKQDSEDYKLAKKELDDLESKKSAATKTNPESLTTPSTNTPVLNPPINLTEDLGPEITPTPSASPVASPTPTPTN